MTQGMSCRRQASNCREQGRGLCSAPLPLYLPDQRPEGAGPRHAGRAVQGLRWGRGLAHEKGVLRAAAPLHRPPA